MTTRSGLTIYVDINIIGSMSKQPPVTLEQTLFVRDHCLCLATRRAARALSRRFDDAFRPLGITNGQFSLLQALNRPEPPPLGAVAHLLVMDRTTITANMKPLERRGLAKTFPDPEDKRLRRLSITSIGQELLAEVMPLWTSLHADIDAMLPLQPHGLDSFREGLAALI